MAGAVAFVACCASSGVCAFTTPTMKVDLIGRTRKPMTNQQKSIPMKSANRGIPPGSPLDMIVKDQQEFELDVGHAMDVLRDDYPVILTENPGMCTQTDEFFLNNTKSSLTIIFIFFSTVRLQITPFMIIIWN